MITTIALGKDAKIAAEFQRQAPAAAECASGGAEIIKSLESREKEDSLMVISVICPVLSLRLRRSLVQKIPSTRIRTQSALVRTSMIYSIEGYQ